MISLGLEIGPSKIKVVELEGHGKGFSVTKFVQVEIPQEGEDRDEIILEKLKELFARHKLPKDRVIVSLDSSEVFLREVQLPFVDPAQIRKTIKFEVEQHIHTHSVEDLVVDYYISSQTDRSSNLLTISAPRELLSRRLKLLSSAGIDPIHIDIDICAILNALSVFDELGKDEHLLVLYCDDPFVKILFIENGKLRCARTLRFFLRDESLDKPSMERISLLGKEVNRFLLSGSLPSPSRMLLFIEDSLAEDTSRLLSESTGLAVKVLEMPEGFLEEKENLSSFLVPFGLSLKGHGIDELGMDFRKEEFVYRKPMEILSGSLTIFLFLLGLFLAVMLAEQFWRKRNLDQTREEILGRQQEEFILMTEREPISQEQIYEEAKRAYDEYKEKLGGGEYPIEFSSLVVLKKAFDVLARFRNRAREEISKEKHILLELKSISIRQARSKVLLEFILKATLYSAQKGTPTSIGDAEVLKNMFREEKLFKNADFQGMVRPLADGKVEFTIASKLSRER
jgi:Tfp pilus assembly PilM family ATPase